MRIFWQLPAFSLRLVQSGPNSESPSGCYHFVLNMTHLRTVRAGARVTEKCWSLLRPGRARIPEPRWH